MISKPLPSSLHRYYLFHSTSSKLLHSMIISCVWFEIEFSCQLQLDVDTTHYLWLVKRKRSSLFLATANACTCLNQMERFYAHLTNYSDPCGVAFNPKGNLLVLSEAIPNRVGYGGLRRLQNSASTTC